MTNKTKQWSTPVALAIALVMVFAAYLIPQWPHLFKASNAEAGTTDDLLKAIAVKDSDGDGLPDWEESLYGTDPDKTDTGGRGMTDAQAVAQGLIVPKAPIPASSVASSTIAKNIPGKAPAPGSLTEQFAQAFFAQYVAAHQGAPLSADDMATFVASALSELERAVPQQDAFTLGQMNVSGSGPEAMRTYAAAAENTLAGYTAPSKKSELLYLGDAISGSDTKALDMIGKIAETYTGGAHALSSVPVPEELATKHLALANALANMGTVTQQLAALDRDPLLTSLGLAKYPDDVIAMRNAFVAMAQTFKDAGVVVPAGEPGSQFLSISPVNGY
ncbi:MAG: thrombospondin type 3 repeat-containing protein [bacterium]